MQHDRLYKLMCLDVLALLLTDEIQPEALEALAEGSDSPSLRILAVLEPSEYDQATRRLHAAFRELSINAPAKEEAAVALAVREARRILDGEVAPYEGTRQIWKYSTQTHGHPIDRLGPFIYAASEWEERPVDREFFEKAIMNEAAILWDSWRESQDD